MCEHDKTLELVVLAKQGDKNAKNELVNQNMPLIKSVIKKFIGKGIEYDDLLQLGCLGFVKSINNFNLEYNVKFSTYVVPMIIGEIKRFMRDDGSIKVSRSIKTQNLKIKHFITEYVRKNNKNPTIEEISDNFGIEPEEIVFIMDSARMPISLYAPIEGESAGKNLFMIDRIEQVDDNEKLFTSIALKQALAELSDRDKKIVLLRFFRDKTQSEVARELGVSQVQVSRLETKILEKLKGSIA